MSDDLSSVFAAHWPIPASTPERILVAVSGGGDSVALLHLARSLPPVIGGNHALHVAHFDHGLRSDSWKDAEWVKALAMRLELPFHGERWSSLPWGTDGPGKVSAETARRARYRFLQESAARIGARWLLMAHTANDQAETILFHLFRGTGLRGLAGIPSRRSFGEALTILRPLLPFRREALRDYLRQNEMGFLEDPSNADPKYTRNRIRHELMPLIASIFRNDIFMSLARLGELAGESQELLDRVAEEMLRGCVVPHSGGIRLRRGRLRELPQSLVRRVLIAAWRRSLWPLQGMGHVQWSMLANQILGTADSTQTYPGRIEVRVDRDDVVCTALATPETMLGSEGSRGDRIEDSGDRKFEEGTDDYA